MHFTLVLKMADKVFSTRLLGKMYSSHFTLDLDPNYAFCTNAKNVLYTVVESMVYFTLVTVFDTKDGVARVLEVVRRVVGHCGLVQH